MAEFLAGGKMGAAIRSHDWTASPLGPISTWPGELRTALNMILSSPESIYLVWGPELIFFFNDAYCPILGPRLENALGQPLRVLWADAWEGVRAPMEKALAGEASRFENAPVTMARHGIEEETWWSFSFSPIYSEDGRVCGVLCFTTETTTAVVAKRQRDEAEAALRERNEALSSEIGRRTSERDRLWQTTNDLMGTAGLDGFLKAINPAWTKMLGWSEQDLLSRPFFEIIDPKDHAETVEVVGRLSKGEKVAGFLDHLFTADGGRRAVMWTAVPEPGTDIFYIVGRDVTDERAAARERERTWEVSPVLKMIVDPDGKLLTINPGFTRALGWKPDEVAGRPVAELLAPEDRETSQARRAGLIAGEVLPEYQVSLLTRDGGQRRVSWTTVVENGVIYAFGRDVTVEREQAEALARSEEALRQSQKMEAVGQLTGGLAHDFNNLLAGISGALELMGRRIQQGRITELEKYMVAAQGAAKRAAALTHRLLAFSRRQTLQPKATNANALVSGMLDLIQRTVGPSVQVESVGASGAWPALVDPSQLENALLNLCINARDAMPEGGKLTIETANRWIDRQAAKKHDMPEGQYLSLCVSDTGVGMTKEVIEKAFDPFFTTKPIGQGTGLGLSMIYGFARQSGGQVRIYSEVGEGTMVCLYLPRHRGATDEEEAAPDSQVIPFAKAGETVLIVDDEPTVRLLVTDVLADLGYTAIEAAESAGGLRVLDSDVRIDLLITDIGLPGMNGRQMVDAARVRRPDLKVLFITGYAENALLNNGQLEPGMSVLTKPFAVDTLAARIREMISQAKPA